MKRGSLTWLDDCLRPYRAARRSVLGEADDAPPRVLLRVDEFPHAASATDPGRYGPERFRAFHDVLSGAGVPYLLAVLPRVADRYMDPRAQGSRPLSAEESDLLRFATQDGATPAVHGLDHRTRSTRPQRWTELGGRSADDLAALLDRSQEELGRHGLSPSVLVPPFNRFDASQLAVLAERFEVVCGGPESVVKVGFQRTPVWLGGTVFIPSYPPLYGSAREVLEGLPGILAEGGGLWLPIVLHWGRESDAGLDDLQRLIELAAPFACSWEDFLADVRASRHAPDPLRSASS